MKRNFVLGALLLVVQFPAGDDLTGRWETKPSVNGHVTGVVFKADLSFEGYVDKKPFTSGVYTFENGILKFTDSGCDGKPGTYNIVFFSDNDSLRFVPIEDGCEQRKEGMQRLVMGRVKK